MKHKQSDNRTGLKQAPSLDKVLFGRTKSIVLFAMGNYYRHSRCARFLTYLQIRAAGFGEKVIL